MILNPPEGFNDILGKLPKGVHLTNRLEGPLDSIHFFTKRRDELGAKFPILKQKLSQNGMLWVSWPKGSSGVETDLNESVVREIGLKNGLVDVKVSAIDKTWLGLKFVYRVKDRE